MATVQKTAGYVTLNLRCGNREEEWCVTLSFYETGRLQQYGHCGRGMKLEAC